MADEIYLFKSAYRTDYRRQNLNILHLPANERVKSRYQKKWLSHEVRGAELQGRKAIIVFTDGPEWNFTPVREATVSEVPDKGSHVEVVLKLGPFIVADDRAFTTMLRKSYRGRIPDQHFMVARDDDFPLVTTTDHDEEIRRWREIIDRIRDCEKYQESVFLRLEGLVDERDRAVENDQLQRNHVYRMRVQGYNPHLAPALHQMEWEVRSEDEILEYLPDPAPPVPEKGVASLAFRVVQDGWTNLHISACPDPKDFGTRLKIELAAYEREAPSAAPPADPVTTLEASRVRRIWQFVKSEFTQDVDCLLRFLDECLIPNLQGEPWPLEERGRLLLQAGRHQEAVDTLAGIDSLSYEYRYDLLFSALLAGRREFWNLHLMLDDSSHRERLKDCLRHLGEEGLLEYARHLLANLGSEQTGEILVDVQGSIQAPRRILQLAEFWVEGLEDAESAEKLLAAAFRDGRLPETVETLEAVLKVRKRLPASRNLVSTANALMDLYLMNGQWKKAYELIENIRGHLAARRLAAAESEPGPATGTAWYRELEYMTMRLVETVLQPEHEWDEPPEVFRLLLDLADAAARASQCDLADYYLERAFAYSFYSTQPDELRDHIDSGRRRVQDLRRHQQACRQHDREATG